MQQINYTVVEGEGDEMVSQSVLLTQSEIDQLKSVMDEVDETIDLLEYKDVVLPMAASKTGRTFQSVYDILAEIKAIETHGQDQANCKARAIIMVQAIIAHIEDKCPDPHSGGHGKGGHGNGRGGHHNGYVLGRCININTPSWLGKS